MKKAKVLLTAIAVLSTVGGALAFKANGDSVMYCGNPDNSDICDLKVHYIKAGGAVNKRDCVYLPITTTCPQIFTTATL